MDADLFNIVEKDNKSMENLLFIGGAGFIGTNVIRHLSKHNVRIFILDHYSSNDTNNLVDRINIVKGSLADTKLIEEIITSKGISKIIHLASCMIPSSDFSSYLHEYENIILPTIKLIKLCSERKIQFIYFSSGGTIYGNHESPTLLRENAIKAPISYYGLSKTVIENFILFEHRTSNLKYLILRPSNPYGPGQNINGKQGLIAVVLGNIINQKETIIWGDGSSIRDYIYIDDLAKIVTQLITDGVSNLIVNLGSGRGYTVNQILSIIEKILSIKLDITYLPDRKNDVSHVILDISLLDSLVQFHRTTLEDGISGFYNYLIRSNAR